MRGPFRFFGLFFCVVLFLIVCSFIWNAIVFEDCMKHGHAMYQCQAAMSNPHYVAVDDMSN